MNSQVRRLILDLGPLLTFFVAFKLGGFFVVEAPDLDAALDMAARCPAASGGVVEVRPILPMMQ